MLQFCGNNGMTQLHGAPRKLSTQGLVERNNQTVKQNIRNILKEKKQSPNHWCQVLGEATYEKNIVEHEATKQTPYELVFGITPWKETKTTLYKKYDHGILPWKKNNNNKKRKAQTDKGCECANRQRCRSATRSR